MEVKIGVQHATRELVIESERERRGGREARRRGAGRRRRARAHRQQGRRVLVPAAQLAYVEIGGGVTGQVGFRS